MARYWTGTAGWSYEDWKGIVYPEPAEKGFHALPFLARYIDIVEINSTFYRPATAAMSVGWLRRVQAAPGFVFAAKLYQAFTHKRGEFTQKDVDDFRAGVAPLRDCGRLAAVLVQFPWSFTRSAENEDYLVKLFGLFPDFPLTVEVRHASWDVPSFYRLLEENKVAFCNIDQPGFDKCIKPGAVVTTREFSYVRFHGRNYKDWFRKGADRDDRYNYLYTTDELREWIARIRNLGAKSDRVYVITNNHYRGQALANALQIKNMISGEKIDVPKTLLDKYPALMDIVKAIERGQMGLFMKDAEDEDRDKERKP